MSIYQHVPTKIRRITHNIRDPYKQNAIDKRVWEEFERRKIWLNQFRRRTRTTHSPLRLSSSVGSSAGEVVFRWRFLTSLNSLTISPYNKTSRHELSFSEKRSLNESVRHHKPVLLWGWRGRGPRESLALKSNIAVFIVDEIEYTTTCLIRIYCSDGRRLQFMSRVPKILYPISRQPQGGSTACMFSWYHSRFQDV